MIPVIQPAATRPVYAFTTDDAERLIRRRMDYLVTQDQGNWHIAVEVKSLLWLLGQYQGESRDGKFVRIVRRRIAWLRQKTNFSAVLELGALEFALRERLAEMRVKQEVQEG